MTGFVFFMSKPAALETFWEVVVAAFQRLCVRLGTIVNRQLMFRAAQCDAHSDRPVLKCSNFCRDCKHVDLSGVTATRYRLSVCSTLQAPHMLITNDLKFVLHLYFAADTERLLAHLEADLQRGRVR